MSLDLGVGLVAVFLGIDGFIRLRKMRTLIGRIDSLANETKILVEETRSLSAETRSLSAETCSLSTEVRSLVKDHLYDLRIKGIEDSAFKTLSRCREMINAANDKFSDDENVKYNYHLFCDLIESFKNEYPSEFYMKILSTLDDIELDIKAIILGQTRASTSTIDLIIRELQSLKNI